MLMIKGYDVTKGQIPTKKRKKAMKQRMLHSLPFMKLGTSNI